MASGIFRSLPGRSDRGSVLPHYVSKQRLILRRDALPTEEFLGTLLRALSESFKQFRVVSDCRDFLSQIGFAAERDATIASRLAILRRVEIQHGIARRHGLH